MFARDKRIGPYTYVYLVENVREVGSHLGEMCANRTPPAGFEHRWDLLGRAGHRRAVPLGGYAGDTARGLRPRRFGTGGDVAMAGAGPSDSANGTCSAAGGLASTVDGLRPRPNCFAIVERRAE
jgi:hypothetical protein